MLNIKKLDEKETTSKLYQANGETSNNLRFVINKVEILVEVPEHIRKTTLIIKYTSWKLAGPLLFFLASH